MIVLGKSQHFPVTEEMAIKFSAVFTCAATYAQCLKHLRFVHKLLRMDNSWYTESVVQVKAQRRRGHRAVRKLHCAAEKLWQWSSWWKSWIQS